MFRNHGLTSVICLFGAIASIALLVVSAKYLGLGDDNPIEEAVEEIIKENTGLEVDLTPLTPEEEDAQEYRWQGLC